MSTLPDRFCILALPETASEKDIVRELALAMTSETTLACAFSDEATTRRCGLRFFTLMSPEQVTIQRTWIVELLSFSGPLLVLCRVAAELFSVERHLADPRRIEKRIHPTASDAVDEYLRASCAGYEGAQDYLSPLRATRGLVVQAGGKIERRDEAIDLSQGFFPYLDEGVVQLDLMEALPPERRRKVSAHGLTEREEILRVRRDALIEKADEAVNGAKDLDAQAVSAANELAIARLREAIALPDRGGHYRRDGLAECRLGQALARGKKLDEAIALFKENIARRPHTLSEIGLRIALGEILLANDRADQAAAILLPATKHVLYDTSEAVRLYEIALDAARKRRVAPISPPASESKSSSS